MTTELRSGTSHLAHLVLIFVLILPLQVHAVRRCKYYSYNLDPGNDLSLKNHVTYVDDCCKVCLATEGCNGFVHNRLKQCWLKPRNGPLVGDGKRDEWDTVTGIIEDVPVGFLEAEDEAHSSKVCEKLPPGTNIDPGHDIMLVTVTGGRESNFEDCCITCKANPACQAFVREAGKGCWLKYADGPLTRDETLTAGAGLEAAVLRSPPTCPTRHIRGPKFAIKPGHDVSPGSGDITWYPTMSFWACAKWCLNCEGCVAFVLDRSVGSTYAAPGQHSPGIALGQPLIHSNVVVIKEEISDVEWTDNDGADVPQIPPGEEVTGDVSDACPVRNLAYQSVVKTAATKKPRGQVQDGISSAQKKEHKCSYCEASFGQTSSRDRHERRHTGLKPYKCETCKKCFADHSNKVKHERVHTGEKPFKCQHGDCGASFAHKQQRTIHVLIHTKEKPFPCTFTGCDSTFARPTDLARHSRIHTGDKPYVCQLCDIDTCFRLAHHLADHHLTHTKEKPYACSICDKSFAVISGWKTHEQTH